MKRLLIFLFLISVAFSCSNDLEDIPADDCPGERLCAFNYKTISVEIKDREGNPFRLDECYTIKVFSGEKLAVGNDSDFPYYQKAGAYPILGDGQMAKTSKAGKEFEFVGKRNGKVVVREAFIIGHDCCHVELKKGETSLVR